MSIAKLVAVSFLTRVIVDENATTEEILEASKQGFIAKVVNSELEDNLEYIKDDTECPFGTFDTDKFHSKPSYLKMPAKFLMPIATITTLLKSDLEAYGTDISLIGTVANYWTKNDNENQRYWTAWFNGDDMQEFN